MDDKRQKHLNLQAEMSKVDNLFYNYVKNNNNSFNRQCYKDYLKFPSLPNETSLDLHELQLQINYINDLFPMIHNIEEDAEFQVMTFVLSEFKADMNALRIKEKNKVTISGFKKVISKGFSFYDFEEKEVLELN